MPSPDKITDNIFCIETATTDTTATDLDQANKVTEDSTKPQLKDDFLSGLTTFTAGLVSSLAILTSIFFVRLSTQLNPAEMSIIKFTVQLLLCIQFKFVYSHDLLGPRQYRPLLVARGLTASISIIVCYFSINLIKFADSMSLRYTSLILTVVFASWLLDEKLKALHYVSVFLVAAGIILIVRPSLAYEANQAIGIVLAVFGAVTTSSTYYFVKKQSTQRLHFSVNVFYFCLTGLVVSVCIALVALLTTGGIKNLGTKLNIHDVSFGVLAGLAKFFGHVVFTLTSAKQRTEIVAFYKLIDIVLAFSLDFLVLGEVPCWQSMLGVGLILTAVGIVCIRRFFLFKDYMNVSVRFKNISSSNRPLVD